MRLLRMRRLIKKKRRKKARQGLNCKWLGGTKTYSKRKCLVQPLLVRRKSSRKETSCSATTTRSLWAMLLQTYLRTPSTRMSSSSGCPTITATKTQASLLYGNPSVRRSRTIWHKRTMTASSVFYSPTSISSFQMMGRHRDGSRLKL